MKKLLSGIVALLLALTFAPVTFADWQVYTEEEPVVQEPLSEAEAAALEILEIFDKSSAHQFFREENRGNLYALREYLTEAMKNDPELYDRLKGIWKDSVDGYSDIFGPDHVDKVASSLREDSTGLVLTNVGGTLVTMRPEANSPAEAAGVKKGAVITAIDDTPATGDVFTDTALYGAAIDENGFVDLTMKLPDGSFKTYHLTLADYDSDAAVGNCVVKGDTGYIKSTGFYIDTPEKFAKAWNAAETAGVKSVIIDMRGNGGGMIDSCYKMLDTVVPDIVPLTYNTTRNEINCVVSTNKSDFRPDIVILTDETTASSAEIFTASLKKAGYARSVGTKSFGKGIGQTGYELSSGNIMMLTALRFFTPDGSTYNRKGITPDFEVIDDPATEADEVLEFAYGYVDGEGTVKEDVDAYRFTYRLSDDFEKISINQLVSIQGNPALADKQVVFSFISSNTAKMNVDIAKAYAAAKPSYQFGIDGKASRQLALKLHSEGYPDGIITVVTAHEGEYGCPVTISLKTPIERDFFYRVEGDVTPGGVFTRFTPAYTYTDGVLRFNIDRGGTFVICNEEIK
ncbi:MAG: hypothetical protein LBL98_07400 [Ruminococcus sp.]|jgi:carboxyl-terminal processing protease|nr:hypothetical protein [Ruminococcus sp.]